MQAKIKESLTLPQLWHFTKVSSGAKWQPILPCQALIRIPQTPSSYHNHSGVTQAGNISQRTAMRLRYSGRSRGFLSLVRCMCTDSPAHSFASFCTDSNHWAWLHGTKSKSTAALGQHISTDSYCFSWTWGIVFPCSIPFLCTKDYLKSSTDLYSDGNSQQVV